MNVYSKSQVFVIFPAFVLCILFGIIKQERGLSLEGVALSGKLFLVKTPQGCHICIMAIFTVPFWFQSSNQVSGQL